MGSILIIEPYRILQQALALHLSKEHEIEARESITGSELRGLKGCDLLVFDASSLDENKLLTPELIRALQSCGAPTLWLEDERSLERPKRDKMLVLKKPLEQKGLKDALESLLVSQNRPQGEAQARKAAPSAPEPAAGEQRKKTLEPTEQANFEFIDLVDVVGEPPARNPGKTPKKTK